RRGFPDVRVDTAVERPNSNDMRIQFLIIEGNPILVDSVVVSGVQDDTLRHALVSDLELKAGAPLDRARLEASRQTVQRRLRQRAFLNARADTATSIDTTAHRATARVDVTLGPQVRLGTLDIQTTDRDGGSPRVPADELEHLIGLQSGDLLGTPQLERLRRTLYDAGVQQEVEIRVDSVKATQDGTGTA